MHTAFKLQHPANDFSAVGHCEDAFRKADPSNIIVSPGAHNPNVEKTYSVCGQAIWTYNVTLGKLGQDSSAEVLVGNRPYAAFKDRVNVELLVSEIEAILKKGHAEFVQNAPKYVAVVEAFLKGHGFERIPSHFQSSNLAWAQGDPQTSDFVNVTRRNEKLEYTGHVGDMLFVCSEQNSSAAGGGEFSFSLKKGQFETLVKGEPAKSLYATLKAGTNRIALI